MLFTILIFIVILSILILVHEFGHFISAKKLGMKVEEFGLGLPPRAWGVKLGETIYSLNWLPFGGFVKIYGEEGEDEDIPGESQDKRKKRDKDRQRAFHTRPVWQRMVVLLAGVFMNFVLAVLILTFLFTQGVSVPVDRVHIAQVSEGSPAMEAGIREGDVILTVNGESVAKGDHFGKIIRERAGEDVAIKILRGSPLKHYGADINECPKCEELEVILVPRLDPPEITEEAQVGEESFFCKGVVYVGSLAGVSPKPKEALREGPIGVVISNYETKVYSVLEAPIHGIKEGLILTREFAKELGKLLFGLVTFQSVPKDIAGPLGIAQMTGTAAGFGFLAVLEFIGILSLNLAIVNILPFPALDGGRLVFVVLEAFIGKKVKSNLERIVHQGGMIFLLTLIVLVTVNDFIRIVTSCFLR